jgi:23S rRNA (pseudouridine1915-N3)-methyltransferase
MKEKYMREALLFYGSQIKKNYKLEIIELIAENTKDFLNNAQADIVKNKECEKIKDKLNKDEYVILLDVNGLEVNSKQLKNIVYSNNMRKIVFIIGGSLGVNANIINACNKKISISKMTFPHQLIRVILLEQLSRL